ncbi:MAG TPA: hypothetical protein ACFYEK_04580 [Candidatus Wunengus sp. YC60]|jgi:NADH:ubiquinone oxidoreductase subunit E|uniref:hypothetical protein n=1 Tax=Candidatus Wunengus sp. YC60 TaxID=3367697 RepID=UPI004025F3CE
MNQIAMLESLIEVLKKQMEIIEQQANDLKCCGNCKNAPVTNIFGEPINGHKVCPKWYPDGLTKIDRV